MKKIKIIMVLLFISSSIFISCSDNDSIEDEAVTKNSMSLRATLNEIKKANNINGRNSNLTQADSFCFTFVYPLTLSYNDGTVVTVQTFEGLIDLISNETQDLYLIGIAFPFQVQQEGAIITITDESEFYSLVDSCNFNTLNEDVINFDCFQIVFPISVVNDNGVAVVIENLNQFEALLQNNYIIDIIFPINVVQQNQTITVNNIYELFNLYDDCQATNPCNCTTDYNPVCVQTPNGIQQYSNMCLAMCDGYTQSDLVNCNSNSNCAINSLGVNTGACNSDGTFPITIFFTATNTTATFFEIYNSSNVLIGYYPIASLPKTINTTSSSQSGTDNLTIKLVGEPNCISSVIFDVPNCNTSVANFGSSLGNCFALQYPVQVQSQGALVTLNDNGSVLQYYNPSQSPIPAFVYPVVATFNTPNGSMTITINSQSQFESLISSNCN